MVHGKSKPLEDVKVEANPEKPRVWLRLSQRNPMKMIDDDARRVRMLVNKDLLLNHVQEEVS